MRDTLFVCQGSAGIRPSDWVVDLMERNASGSVWRVDLASAAMRAASPPIWPFPMACSWTRSGGGVVVAESWRHRLVAHLPRAVALRADRAGQAARLSGAAVAAAADGGAWLGLFAPRNRLIEFVLQEDAYRADMMREVPRAYWIAPALSSGASFLEPLQCGGVKTMGIHKPWSPTRSYGLVARLDRDAAADHQLPQPRQRPPPWHDQRRSKSAAACSSPPRAATRSSISGGGEHDRHPLIEMQKITKAYHGAPAIKTSISTCAKGEIHALLGENGAGKSTLTKVMAGVVEATSGTDALSRRGGQLRLALEALARRHRHGLPGDQPRPLDDGGAEPLSRRREVPQPAARHLHRGAAVPAVAEFPRRSHGHRSPRSAPPSARWWRSPAPCITRPRSSSSTSRPPALTPEEKRHFFTLMRRLKARGVSIVFISHALEEALAHADRITILRDGERVVTDDAKAFDRDKVIRAMVGPHPLERDLPGAPHGRAAAPGRGRRSVGAGHLDGQRGAQQFLLDL